MDRYSWTPASTSSAPARRRARAPLTAAIAAAVLLAACSTDGSGPSSTAPEADSTVSPLVEGQISGVEKDPERASAFREEAQSIRESAVEDGASDAQLAIIDAAAEDGLMSMERLLEARDAYAECLDSIGFTLIDMGVQMNGGVAYPAYSTQTSAGYDPDSSTAEDNLESTCMEQHFMSVDRLYQSQPLAVQAHDADFTRALPEIIPCLQDEGLAVDDEATVDEVKAVLMESLREASESGQSGGPPVGLDCAHEASIDSW